MSAAQTALKAIRNKGAPHVYVAISTGSYNPATSRASLIKTRLRVHAVITEYVRGDTDGDGKRRYVTATLMFAAAEMTVIPKEADRVELEGVELAVVEIETIFDGATPAVHMIKVKAT